MVWFEGQKYRSISSHWKYAPNEPNQGVYMPPPPSKHATYENRNRMVLPLMKKTVMGGSLSLVILRYPPPKKMSVIPQGQNWFSEGRFFLWNYFCPWFYCFFFILWCKSLINSNFPFIVNKVYDRFSRLNLYMYRPFLFNKIFLFMPQKKCYPTR